MSDAEDLKTTPKPPPCAPDKHVFVSVPGAVTLVGECSVCGESATNEPLKAWLDTNLAARRGEQGEEIPERSGPGWDGHMTCEAAPVQIEGTIDGCPFYFRARWSEWRMTIAPPGGDAIGCHCEREGHLYAEMQDYGDGEADASWMPHAEAWGFIAECIEAFRKERFAAATKVGIA